MDVSQQDLIVFLRQPRCLRVEQSARFSVDNLVRVVTASL